jgi:propionyl-CoA synthetase
MPTPSAIPPSPGILGLGALRAPAYSGPAVTNAYDDAYADSLAQPARFWARAADEIEWVRRPRAVFDTADTPTPRWFPGGMLNTCHNALDLHITLGRGDQNALIYDSPVTDSVRHLTYAELRDEVARFAGVLRDLGVERGDRVLIYMPMIPESVIGMLACARLGAIHSVVFGGFASNELAQRIQHAAPKVILTASCGIEPGRIVEYKPLLDRAIEMASNKPAHCVVYQRPQREASLVAGRDRDWNECVAAAAPAACVPVQSTEPLYILYTSGTTGMPKGVVRDNGGHAVALKWSFANVYGMKPGDVFWAASDIGWVVGHSYIVYAPLLSGCTTLLYEGKPVGTPDAGAFWRVASQHRVNALFTAPTAIRAVKREDPLGERIARYDLSSLRTLFLAGERADPDTVRWSEEALGISVIDHWWQTETGWPIAANCLGLAQLPVKRGSSAKPVPGYRIRVLDDVSRRKTPG